jgi:hypothetical protein
MGGLSGTATSAGATADAFSTRVSAVIAPAAATRAAAVTGARDAGPLGAQPELRLQDKPAEDQGRGESQKKKQETKRRNEKRINVPSILPRPTSEAGHRLEVAEGLRLTHGERFEVAVAHAAHARQKVVVAQVLFGALRAVADVVRIAARREATCE